MILLSRCIKTLTVYSNLQDNDLKRRCFRSARQDLGAEWKPPNYIWTMLCLASLRGGARSPLSRSRSPIPRSDLQSDNKLMSVFCAPLRFAY